MPRLRAPFILSGIAAAVLLASCGGGGGGSSDASSQQKSQLQLAITDAPGDFLAYTVDIKSITLKKANGTEVETVPVTSRIDLTQYTDLSELFNVLTVPTGTYSEVDLNVDYSNAEILVEGDNGGEVAPTVVDADGNTVKEMALKLQFPESEPFEVKAGEPAQLSIDFDLDSSNVVDMTTTPTPTLTVEPVLYASTKLNENRDHRVRGLLESVDTSANTFLVDLLPLYLTKGSFGQSTVTADENTSWNINGTQYTGLAGVAALAALPKDTPIVTVGKVSDSAETVTATTVLAGSSVPWVGREAVQGVVIKRDGDTLYVRGRAVEVDDTAHFTRYKTVPVTLSSDTAVSRQVLSDTGLTKDAVSVGQRVTVFGDLAEDGQGGFTMDATKGHVHMEVNQVEGEVVSKSPLVMNLEEINGRSTDFFDFTGTGKTAGDNTDPTHFEVDTGNLSLSSVDVDEYIKVRGYENSYGQAPVDFNALSIIDPNQYNDDVLYAYWNPSQNTDAILNVATDSIELNTDETAHGVLSVQIIHKDGVVAADPTTLTLVPDSDGKGNFVVKTFRNRDMTVFHNFDTFDALIKENDEAGRKLVAIEARGRYDEVTKEFEVSDGNAVFKRNDDKRFDWDEDHNPGKHKGHHGRDHGAGHH
ncbi:MAG TPA: DUF4382 domain-containing protein [Pseudomonadales bacterium]|nr:DUF4382 domain-containing protein [Pseudomonadales bacterium]